MWHDVASDVDGKRPLVRRRGIRRGVRRRSSGCRLGSDNSSEEKGDGKSPQELRGCYPPREIVIATMALPRMTMAAAIQRGRWPEKCPNA